MSAVINTFDGIADFATKYVLLEFLNKLPKELSENIPDYPSAFIVTPANVQYASDTDLEIAKEMKTHFKEFDTGIFEEEESGDADSTTSIRLKKDLQQKQKITMRKPNINLFSNLVGYKKCTDYGEELPKDTHASPTILVNKINKKVTDKFSADIAGIVDFKAGDLINLDINTDDIVFFYPGLPKIKGEDEMLEEKSTTTTEASTASSTAPDTPTNTAEHQQAVQTEALLSSMSPLDYPVTQYAKRKDLMYSVNYINNLIYRLFALSNSQASVDVDESAANITDEDKKTLETYFSSNIDSVISAELVRWIYKAAVPKKIIVVDDTSTAAP